MVLLLLARRFLLKRKWSTTGASLAVGLTVFLIIFNDVVFTGVINGIVRDMTDMRFGDVYITKEKGLLDRPDHQIVSVAKSIPNVVAAAPRFTTRANVNHTTIDGVLEVFNREVVGVDPLLEQSTSQLGNSLISGSLNINRKTVILGKEVADDLAIREGDIVSVKLSDMEAQKYRVGGVIDSPGFVGLNRAVIMHIQEVREILGVKNRQSTSVIVKLKERGGEEEVKVHLQARFPKFKIETSKEAAKDITEDIREGVSFINLVGYAGVLASGLGITTILTMIVTSKTRDIGILRAVGVQRRGIVLIFVAMAATIGMVGATVGAFLGVVTTFYFATNKVAPFGGLVLQVSPSPDPQILAFPVFMGFMVSILASLFPAWKASTYEPAEAMRYF